jgi:hypothetical protein
MLRRLVALILMFLGGAAMAVPQPVQVGGSFQFELGAAPFVGLGFTVNLVAPEPGDAGFFVQGDTAWGFSDLAGLLSIDGAPRDDSLSQIAWFAYPGSTQGVDLRFADVFVPGDWMQLVLFTHTPLFDGTVSEPILRLTSRNGLAGFVGYQDPDGDYLDGVLYAGHYKVGVVPEPAALLLLALGLPAVLRAAGKRRSRSARATGVC